MDALLTKCKAALRLTTDSCDTEVTMLVQAAQLDLIRCGVMAALVMDAAQRDSYLDNTIVIYVKATFGFNNPDSERLWSMYQAMLVQIGLSSKYVGAALAAPIGE